MNWLLSFFLPSRRYLVFAKKGMAWTVVARQVVRKSTGELYFLNRGQVVAGFDTDEWSRFGGILKKAERTEGTKEVEKTAETPASNEKS